MNLYWIILSLFYVSVETFKHPKMYNLEVNISKSINNITRDAKIISKWRTSFD